MREDGVDPAFVRTFLWSEEARFGIPHLVIGERGWSRSQDKIRMKTWRAFVERALGAGDDWAAAKSVLAMADPLLIELDKEARGTARYPDAEFDDGSSVTERLARAEEDRSYFMLLWQDRVRREGFTPDLQLGGLSRVGQMRAQGGRSDPMSQTLQGKEEFDGIKKLNDWFKGIGKGGD